MQIGDTYEYHNTVTQTVTADALGSGGIKVLGTPCLVCWFESAAYYYM